MNNTYCFFFFFSFLFYSVLHAGLLPEIIDGVKTVKSEEVIELLKDKKYRLIDTRSLLEYSEGHIPSAEHIFFTDDLYSETEMKWDSYKEKQSTWKALLKMKKLNFDGYIFYCNGVDCRRSYNAIKFIIFRGCQSELFWFRGGLPEWFESGLPVKEGITP